MIDRRAFLRRLGFGTVAAAAAANGVLDVERLLWVPGEKTIVIPSPAVLTNGFHSIEWIASEALRVLKRQLTLTAGFNRPFDDVRLGDTVHIPLPVRFDSFRPARIVAPVVNVYGKLPVPAGVTEGCVVTSEHLSLRGLKAHDLELDRDLLRFDVVGGKV